MANIYNVDYTDKSVDPENKQPIVIPPGGWDKSTTLSLPGYSAALYGEHIAENFVQMLENFASETQPYNPTIGQLWYVPSIKSLKVLIKITTVGEVKTYTWRVIGSTTTSITEPEDKTSLWYDISNADPMQWQLKIYNTGTSKWTSVADRYVLKAGDTMTGPLVVGNSGVGFTADKAKNGSLSGFYPGMSTDDTQIRSANSLVLMFNGSSTAARQFVITSEQDPTKYADPTNFVLSAQVDGSVRIHRGTLDLSMHKLIRLSPGTVGTDGVNIDQLNALRDAANAAIQSLEDRKVNRSGDTMTGGLIITGTSVVPNVGPANLYLKSAAGGTTGLVIDSMDATGTYNAINVMNRYGVAGAAQAVFMVKAFTGNTTIAGTVQMNKTLTVSGSTSIFGSTYLGSVSTMDVPATSIVAARHLVTKEFLDAAIEAAKPKETYARINPAVPRDGDILPSGGNLYMYLGGWKQVFPAQWAP